MQQRIRIQPLLFGQGLRLPLKSGVLNPC